MRIDIVCMVLIINSCTLSHGYEERKTFIRNKIIQLEDSLRSLKVDYELSETYKVSAETHQVTRSSEERERQLKNLNDYRTELKINIKGVEVFLDNYRDSLLTIDH